MRAVVAAAVLLGVAAADAQQIDASKLVAALQQQRNEALDKAAIAEAKAAALQAELDKLKAEQDKK